MTENNTAPEFNLNLMWAETLYGLPITPDEYHEMVSWYINNMLEDQNDAQ